MCLPSWGGFGRCDGNGGEPFRRGAAGKGLSRVFAKQDAVLPCDPAGIVEPEVMADITYRAKYGVGHRQSGPQLVKAAQAQVTGGRDTEYIDEHGSQGARTYPGDGVHLIKSRAQAFVVLDAVHDPRQRQLARQLRPAGRASA
jgi:hypothetical protein